MKGIQKDVHDIYEKVNSVIVMLEGEDVDEKVIDTLYQAVTTLRDLVDELGVDDEDLDFADEEPRYEPDDNDD